MNRCLTPIAQISTEQAPPARRVELWESYSASALVGLRCSDFSQRGLEVGARCFDLGAVRITEMRGNEHVVERTSPLVRSHPKNVLFACLLLEGEGFFYQSRQCIPVHSGDIIAFLSDIPYLYGWVRESRQLIVETDLDRLPGCRSLSRLQSPLRLDSRLQSSRLLGSALRSTAGAFLEHPYAEDAPRITARAHCLFEALLAPTEARREPTDTALWQLMRAEIFIAEHLADQGLAAPAIARALKISVRHLNRLFATRQTTVSEWIWSQRLARAYDDLGGGRCQSIAEVAFRWGFVNQGHFARRFKDRYGVTPTQHRRQPLPTNGH